jgi:ribosomal protein L7Ae-like RNA K-turn-binding protein
MQNNKITTYLGLAARARTMKAGEEAVLAALKHKNARLLVIAENASENAKKRWRFRAESFQVPYIIFGTQEELGRAIGSSFKTIVAVCDPNLAQAIIKQAHQ